MKVLITGGAGYIGSTIASCCEDNGHQPVIIDDLSTGLAHFARQYPFYQGDIANSALIERVCAEHPDIDAVIHCAAKIVVPESVEKPFLYYTNNVSKTITLLEGLQRHGVERLILSSTASMYLPGPDYMVDETSAVDPQSPYAGSKRMIEQILQDAAKAGLVRALSLRYFNPIGADPQLRTGLQNPKPSHALGKIIDAHRNGAAFTITGTDWPTRDGTGLRDYIHVWDLARAHVNALERLDDLLEAQRPFDVINLGTGTGTTVRELVTAFTEAVGADLEVQTAPPRPGDVVGCASRTDKANAVLGWRAERSIADGVRDALAWSHKLEDILVPQAR